jgi:excisionase family DNA binding protein
MMGTFPEVMSLQQAADYLHISYVTALRWVTRGELPARKLGGVWRVSKKAVDAIFERPTLSAEAQKALVQVMPLPERRQAG